MRSIRLYLVLAVVVLALQMLPAEAQYPVSGYTRIYEGVEYATGYTTSPRLMRAYALRISLKNPDVSLFATPSNGGQPYEALRQTTQNFLNTYGLAVAVNANYFNIGLSPNTDVWGLLMSNGTLVSPDQSDYPTKLLFTAAKDASIDIGAGNPPGIYNAIAGDAYHLVNGVALGANNAADPRTSAGISMDGKYLILVVVDGRRAGWSNGATVYDMSLWQLSFGAWNAMNLDSGGSTQMVRQDIGVVNRPSETRTVINFGASTVPAGTGGPGACSMNSGRIDMVRRGSDNAVYWSQWTAAGGWVLPVSLGGSTPDSPCIVSRRDGWLEAFARGWDNQLYHNWNSGGGWSGWYSLGGSIISGPAATSQNADNIEVVARGSGSDVQRITLSAGGWSGWSSLGGVTYYQPGIVSRQNGFLEVYATGTDNQLYHRYNNGGGWSDWIPLGGSLASGPSVISRNASNTEVYARSSGGGVDEIYFDASYGWYPWLNMGGSCAGTPGATRLGNTAKVFLRGTDDYLYENYWNGGWWSGWQSWGAYFYP